MANSVITTVSKLSKLMYLWRLSIRQTVVLNVVSIAMWPHYLPWKLLPPSIHPCLLTHPLILVHLHPPTLRTLTKPSGTILKAICQILGVEVVGSMHQWMIAHLKTVNFGLKIV